MNYDRCIGLNRGYSMTEKELYLTHLAGCLSEAETAKITEFLESTDFFEAPASTRYHLAREGGLCRHSLNVLEAGYMLAGAVFKYSPLNSVTKTCLLHDLCKINTYKTAYRNVKSYAIEDIKNAEPWQIKHDAMGDYMWKSVPSYTYEDDFTMGHGEKSVYLASKYVTLTDYEAQAIRWHMGAFQDGEKLNAGKAFGQNSLALLLHMADLYATNILEKNAG